MGCAASTSENTEYAYVNNYKVPTELPFFNIKLLFPRGIFGLREKETELPTHPKSGGVLKLKARKHYILPLASAGDRMHALKFWKNDAYVNGVSVPSGDIDFHSVRILFPEGILGLTEEVSDDTTTTTTSERLKNAATIFPSTATATLTLKKGVRYTLPSAPKANFTHPTPPGQLAYGGEASHSTPTTPTAAPVVTDPTASPIAAANPTSTNPAGMYPGGMAMTADQQILQQYGGQAPAPGATTITAAATSRPGTMTLQELLADDDDGKKKKKHEDKEKKHKDKH